MRAWITLSWLLAGCGSTNPCMDYCKRLDAWYDDCGTTWEAEHPGGELDSLEDCYDHYWEAEIGTVNNCEKWSRELPTRECY